jgi:hypothetical protein
MSRCGSSGHRARRASAVFKIFVLHPKKTFSTASVNRSTLTVGRSLLVCIQLRTFSVMCACLKNAKPQPRAGGRPPDHPTMTMSKTVNHVPCSIAGRPMSQPPRRPSPGHATGLDVQFSGRLSQSEMSQNCPSFLGSPTGLETNASRIRARSWHT